MHLVYNCKCSRETHMDQNMHVLKKYKPIKQQQ